MELKTTRSLLSAYGAVAAILWLPFVAAAIAVGGMAGAKIGSLEFLFGFAGPLVTFCSYPLLARRQHKYGTFVAWGIVAHLPLLYWLEHVKEDPVILTVSCCLLIGLLLYAMHGWKIRQTNKA